MVLLKGTFETNVASIRTVVHFSIRANYEAICTFTTMGVSYKFNMVRWRKTANNVINANWPFTSFAALFHQRYGVDNDNFGTHVINEENGVVEGRSTYTTTQITNILVYAAIDVFVCAEEIILTHRRSLLDYCIYHREKNQCDTYENYIHLVACHCLVHSNYFSPGIHYVPVEFVVAERQYSADQFNLIKRTKKEDEDEDEGTAAT